MGSITEQIEVTDVSNCCENIVLGYHSQFRAISK